MVIALAIALWPLGVRADSANDLTAAISASNQAQIVAVATHDMGGLATSATDEYASYLRTVVAQDISLGITALRLDDYRVLNIAVVDDTHAFVDTSEKWLVTYDQQHIVPDATVWWVADWHYQLVPAGYGWKIASATVIRHDD